MDFAPMTFYRRPDGNLYIGNMNFGSDIDEAGRKFLALVDLKILLDKPIVSLETYLENYASSIPLANQNIKLYSGLTIDEFANLSSYGIKEKTDEYIIFKKENDYPGTVFSLERGMYEKKERKPLATAFERLFEWDEGSLKSKYGCSDEVNIVESFSKLFDYCIDKNIPLVLRWIRLEAQTSTTLINGIDLSQFTEKLRLENNVYLLSQ